MGRKLLLSVLSGLILALSWPTYGFSLLIFVGFVPLLFVFREIIKENKGKIWNKEEILWRDRIKNIVCVYTAFVIFNAITTWWIWNSTHYGAVFAIVVNSFFMMEVFFVYEQVARRTSDKKALIFLVTFWICFEKLHFEWDLSWPWLTLGNVFSEDIIFIQWYEYTGVFGGTLWVWCVNILFYKIIERYIWERKFRLSSYLIGLFFVVFVPIIFSVYLFWSYTPSIKKAEVAVLQPNIDPYKDKYNFGNEQMGILLSELSDKGITGKTEFILAPETVFADVIPIESLYYDWGINYLKGSLLSKNKDISLVCGVSMYKILNSKNEITPQSNYVDGRNIWYNEYNSAILANKTDSLGLYHKSKLVVGVENLPYQVVTRPLLGKLMIDLGGTISLKTTQSERSVFKGQKEVILAPIICYESIYGEFVNGYVKNGANLLGIITNDSWWGNTQGHKQLLSYAKLRAIETRRSVARSANTGISSFINEKGEIIKSLPYNSKGSLSSEVTINNKITFYVKYGDYTFRISLFISLFLFLITFTKRRFTF